MSQIEMKYRENVAAILRNARGQILICERIGMRDNWQFPQGGIDEGETPEEALVREISEEIGVKAADFTIVRRQGPYRYLFGNGKMKKGHHGKNQVFFLCDFTGADSSIDVAQKHAEFQAFRWILPSEFQLRWLPEMKREVYRAVFSDFFEMKIEMRA